MRKAWPGQLTALQYMVSKVIASVNSACLGLNRFGICSVTSVVACLFTLIGRFCKPNFGNFDGNGPRPGARVEK